MLKVYACGGAASNVLKQLKDLDVDVSYIDTSISNLKGVNPNQTYVLENFDGAGKLRATTYEGFKSVTEDVLIQFKPSDNLNVVVSSLSGGSGAIINSFITRELISRGHSTIVIGIGSKSSMIELDNTVKSLKTLKSISGTTSKSVTLLYVDKPTRREADEHVIRFLNLLSLLVNKEHTAEFDRADMHNFINFDRVTDNKPSVGIIELNMNETLVPEKNTNIATTILVTTDSNSTISSATPEYLSTCIVTDPHYKNEDIRIDNVLGKLSIVIDSLEEQIQTFRENKKINKFKEIEVTDANDDGIVI